MEDSTILKKLSNDLTEFRGETQERFGEMEKRFEQVDKRFEQIDKRFEGVDKRFGQVDERFEGIDKRLDTHEELLNRLVQYSMENEERISRIEETFATKEDIRGIHITLDEILGYVKKQDQEATFSKLRMDRLEEKVEDNTQDIIKLKDVVGVV